MFEFLKSFNLFKLKKSLDLFSKLVTNYKVQYSMLALLIVYLFFLVRIPANRILVTDPHQKLSTVFLPKDYKWEGVKGKNVEVGLYVTNFKEFSIEKNKFVMDCIIWFALNKNSVDIKKIHSFAIKNGKIINKKFSRIIALDEERVLAQYEVRIDFKSNFDYEHYPFDDHRISITIANFNFSSDNSIIFYTAKENFGFNENLDLKNWEIFNREVYYGFDHIELDKKDIKKNITHPAVVYSFILKKLGNRRLVTIFLPLLILSLLAFLGLLIPIKFVEGRLLLMISSLTSLIFYRFVIESVMPDTGYFTRTDYVFAFGLIFIFLLLMIEVMVIRRLIVQADFDAPIASNRITLARLVNGYAFIITTIFYAILLSILVLF